MAANGDARARERPAAGLTLRLAAGLAAGLFLALLCLPLLSLFLRVAPQALLRRLATPLVAQALWLSLRTSVLATAAVALLGLPIAYVLAAREFPGKRVLAVLVDLPMVLPPTVAGVGLLLAFGRLGLVGRLLAPLGVSIPFTELAVVLAQMFVAGPFFINAARAGLEAVEPRYLQAATTLGASTAYTFFRVMVPLCLPALVSGAAMTWARALGEFGATITFAGNFPGRTQTMPLAVYVALQGDLDAAVALSVLLVVVAFTLLFALRALPAARAPRD
jgi:molybdate transport system permease protein